MTSWYIMVEREKDGGSWEQAEGSERKSEDER
jgi:hypothetical protein